MTSRPRWSTDAPSRVDGAAYPGHAAVILSDVGRLEFLSSTDPSKGYRLTQHVRLKVLTPAGRRLARVQVPVDHWTRLESFHGAAYAPGAPPEQISWAPRDGVAYLSRAPESGQLYSDARLAVVDIPGAAVGSIVEYEVVIVDSDTASIRAWLFEHPQPVLRSRFEAEVPPGWKLKWGFTEKGAVSSFDPTQEGGKLVWELSDLPPLEAEPYGLPLSHLVRRLQVTVSSTPDEERRGVFDTWADIGAWYRALAAGLDRAPADALAELDKAIQAEPGAPKEDVIFRFVRDRIRYVAIHDGVGALRPHAAPLVYASGYGDCKDMTTLLVSLYRAHGFDAHPVLVGTRDSGVWNGDIPTLSAFNHMVAGLRDPSQPGGWRLVDATAKGSRLEEVPWAIQGQTAVVVRPDGVDLVEIPIAGPEVNVVEREWSLDPKDARAATFVLRARGIMAAYWRDRGRSSELAEAVSSAAAFDDKQRISEARVVEETPGEVKVTARVSLEGVLQRIDDRELLPLARFFGTLGEVRVPADRQSPVDLGPPSTWVDRIRVSGARVVARLPSRAKVESPVAEYELVAAKEADGVVLSRTFKILGARAPVSVLPALKTLADAVSTDQRDAIQLGGVR